MGQSEAIGLNGASASLTTQAGGFWPIVSGAIPSLDLDADGIQAFFDTDDDNDGLLDGVETNTGIYVSPTDTGTNPLDPDSDGDGFADVVEIAQGSDPNDPNSPQIVPALPPAAIPVIVALFLGGASPAFRGRKEIR